MGSAITIDHILKPKPAQQFQFLGKWLVGYDPAEFAYPAILSLLATLQDRLQSQKLVYKYVHLQLGRSVVRNRYFLFADRLFIAHNGVDQRLLKTDPGAFVVRSALAPLARPVRSVSLLFPRLDSDPRWKTMGLPAAQLFLASGLQTAGFQVTASALSLPDENRPSEALKADMTGFTLFEDLLPALRPFLADFKAAYDGILAAGGPFPTLAPLAALQHLPQINLFIRGEAEIGLPFILDALNRGDIDALFRVKGFFWQQPGVIVISDLDRVMRPETFRRFTVDLGFLRPEHVQDGLEMNFSRGCNRGCLFCCRVQGRTLRKLPLDKAEEMLKAYDARLSRFQPNGSAARTVNINDDDILQDPAYAAAIFALLKKYDFRIHGIQTAPASLLDADGRAKGAVLYMIKARDLYVEDRPLLWLGSDVFLSRRARRLGKRLPSREGFTALLAELEKRGLRHFHYWIGSDGESTWEEFVEELSLIVGFYAAFPGFGLLAHAPFVVPYPASRLFGRLDPDTPNLKFKLDLNAPDPRFAFRVVERLETRWPQLNCLLRNEKAGGEAGFFDLLKAKDFMA
ncbi:MAG TPA: hypothetical protein VLQ89_05120, partial [Candidatus Binatia bacterium]|nr:hypothetical protein [Candidatus Binatia bacterium]